MNLILLGVRAPVGTLASYLIEQMGVPTIFHLVLCVVIRRTILRSAKSAKECLWMPASRRI